MDIDSFPDSDAEYEINSDFGDSDNELEGNFGLLELCDEAEYSSPEGKDYSRPLVSQGNSEGTLHSLMDMDTDNSVGVGTAVEDEEVSGDNDTNLYADITAEEALSLEFDSEKHCEDWYKLYGLSLGFGYSLSSIKRDKTGKINWREYVCNKEGFRKREYTELNERSRTEQRKTRCGCLARCVMNFKPKLGKWKLTIWQPIHNHPMTKESQKHFIRSNRRVSKEDLDAALEMRSVNIGTAQAFELMVNNRGGYNCTGFLQKDLYNSVNDALRKMDGDSDAFLDYMHDRGDEDPGHRCIFGLDEEGRLGHVFWRDSLSLEDYERFNDTLLFDSTYKTNLYGRPLVLLVGVNHHRMTVLFGCAILIDERTESYVWLLKTFLKYMNGKVPGAVLTDGDEAMRNAIEEVMPNAIHRLCTWHVAKNMVAKIKDRAMQKLFMKCMHKPMAINEFESTWEELVNGTQAGGASESVMAWLHTMYSKRERWAEVFFNGNFFAMMCSTQRVEGMNKHLKRGLSRVTKIFEVPYRIAVSVNRMRENVLREDFSDANSTPVLTTMFEKAEEKLGNQLTDHMFRTARKQMSMVAKYNVIHCRGDNGDGTLYWELDEAFHQDRRWGVEFADQTFICSCGLFETDGIPCAHIYTCMKTSHINELPDKLIHPRWSIGSRDTARERDRFQFGSNVALSQVRCCQLRSLSNSIVYDASNNGDAYKIALKALTELKISVEKYRVPKKVRGERGTIHYSENVVLDPETQKSKKARQAEENDANGGRAPRAQIHCSYCGEAGHNTKGCQPRKIADAAENENMLSK